MSIVREGFRLLREDGIREFLRSAYRYGKWKITVYRSVVRAKAAMFRGQLTLAVNDSSAEFIVENQKSVERTVRRFELEHRRLSRILDDLKEDDVFYDIGANTGLYTCLASNVCSSVVSFEPYPPNVQEFKKNIEKDPIA